MKILMIIDKVFPEDERVEKEIISLLSAGHEVRVASYTFAKTDFRDDSLDYINYRRKIGKLMYKFGAVVLVLPFYFNYWRKYVRDIYNEWKFEAIHIHDLPLAQIGVELKRNIGILFIADQHELYSSWIVKNAHYNTHIGKLVGMFSNWEAYEKKCLSEADLVCTVEKPLRDIYLKKYDLEPGKVIVVPNTPLSSTYKSESRGVSSHHFTLFYCGGIDVLRGLDNVVRALPLLKENIPEIRLLLVGRKSRHYEPEQLADQLGVGELLEFREWVDFQELHHEIDQGDICFFTPPVDREEINNTIATKIYQYIARGKPVIVGSARYMKAFVEEHKIGVVIDEESPSSIAEAVLQMYLNPDIVREFSENALKTANDFYWEVTINDLLEYYKMPSPTTV